MLSFNYQIQQAFLTLRKKPGFVFSVVTTMGLSLGALLCVLTLAYVVLYKALPYPEQNKLFQLNQHTASKDAEFSGFDYPTTVALYKKQQVFTQSAISYHSDEVISSHPKQIVVNTSFVTPQWFSLLGVPFEHGRALDENEGLKANIPVAILSYKTWRNDYNADKDILNKTININDVSYKIIGVTGADFVDPQLNKSGFDTQLWLPWDFNPISYKHDWWGSYDNNLIIFGKKVEKTTISQVSQQTYNLICQILEPAVAQDFADPCTNIRIETKTLKQVMIGDSSTVIYLLLTGAIALIIITATNMINLFVAHAAEQQHLFAINAALGAKKRDLVLGLFIQVSLLMLVANLLSLFIANSGFYLLSHYVNEFLPLVSQLTLQAITIIPLIILSVVITLIIAKLGTSAINYQHISARLQSGSKGINAQVSSKIRKGLIICQIAIASALVFCSVNISLNAAEKITNPLGYERSNLSYLSVSISQLKKQEKPSFEQSFSLIKQIKKTLLDLPEINNISTAESPIGSFMALSINDVDTNKGYVVETSFADEHYFKLIGQPLISGDNFVQQTQQNRDQVLIINERFAKQLGGNENVIGKKLDFSNDGSNVYTVIGIVRGILAPGAEEVPMRMYAPASTLAPKFLIKFEENQMLSREQIIKELQGISGLLVISQYKSLADSFNQTLQVERIALVSTIVVTVISLLLAALGLYGILSYSTQMRGFEIGTRLALGAKRGDIIKLIVQDNTSAIMIGLIVSTTIMTTLSFIFREQFNTYINWKLLPLFLLTCVLICSISFIACYLPLRQYINKPAQYSLRGAE